MKVYLDHAATTPIDPRVLEKMLPFLKENFGNPSSIHSFGRKAKVALEEARETVAEHLNAETSEIYFVSGGTEANNFSIFGIAKTEFSESGRKGIATSKAEHHSVLESCEKLSEEGFDVFFADINPDSTINIANLTAAIGNNVSLVSVIHTNNETGAINDIKKISALKEKYDFYMHTDAVQSFGKIPIDVKELNIDSLSISGHKIGGPKGIGAVFAKSGTPLSSLIFGGSQERNRRGGTENVAGIIGFAEAVKIAGAEMKSNNLKVKTLFDEFVNGIRALDIEGLSLNLSDNHSPYILSVTFGGEYFKSDSEAMLIYLDINGIAASNGAACASGTLKPSHVILSMGKSIDDAKGTVRFSLSSKNSVDEIHYTLDVLKRMAEKFRL